MLLPAVGAVSAVSVSIEKPVVVTAETSGLQTTATPAAVLSSAVNASVEGKLNMLLVAARERMFNSLLSAIDTAARALNLAREPGESNAVYAQRVAAAISNLSPPQLAAAQQRMDAQMSTPVPLPLLAAALADPESPQAVQLALSLEQASTVEPDAVLKAVVNSYGQNAGEAKAAATQPLAPAILQKVADIAAQAASLASPVKGPTPAGVTAQPTQTAPALQEAAQSGTTSPSPPTTTQAASGQALPQTGTVTTPQAAPAASAGLGINAATTSPSQPVPPPGNPVAGPLLAAIVAEAKLPIEIELIRSPLAPPPVPRDIQKIEADLKQGLQVVINPPAMAINSDLLQIINNPAASVEKIIAQALTANAAGQTQQQPVDESGRSRPIPPVSAPVALASEEEISVPVAALSGRLQVPTSAAAATAMYNTAEQAGMPVSVPLGVPFAVANYLPAAAPSKASEQKRIDRVDPVGDEEGQNPDEEETAQHEDEDEPRAEEPPAQMTEETSGDAETQTDSLQSLSTPPELAALPRPLPSDRQQDHAFDFYRRMVAWE